MARPSHSPRLDYSNYTWRTVQITKLVMQFPPTVPNISSVLSELGQQIYHHDGTGISIRLCYRGQDGRCVGHFLYKQKQTPWPESASELYRPNVLRLSTKLVPTVADRGCHMVIVSDPYSRNLGFLDRNCYCLFQVAPQLYSRG
jgi:hypothetical protein